jgi:hypothetical protein
MNTPPSARVVLRKTVEALVKFTAKVEHPLADLGASKQPHVTVTPQRLGRVFDVHGVEAKVANGFVFGQQITTSAFSPPYSAQSFDTQERLQTGSYFAGKPIPFLKHHAPTVGDLNWFPDRRTVLLATMATTLVRAFPTPQHTSTDATLEQNH